MRQICSVRLISRPVLSKHYRWEKTSIFWVESIPDYSSYNLGILTACMDVLAWPGWDKHSPEINEVSSILEYPIFTRFSSKTISKLLLGASKLRREKKFGCVYLPGLEFRAAAYLTNKAIFQESTMLDLHVLLNFLFPDVRSNRY